MTTTLKLKATKGVDIAWDFDGETLHVASNLPIEEALSIIDAMFPAWMFEHA